MQLMNPCGTFQTTAAPLTPRVELGADTVVGLFANDKKNADVLLTAIQGLLEQTNGVTEFRWFTKEASQPAAFTEAFIAECDVVVAAICD